MDLSTIANVINAIAVTAGVLFAAVQIREFRRQRRRQSRLSGNSMIRWSAFAKSGLWNVWTNVYIDRAAMRAQVGAEGEAAIYFVTTTWETIGVLVFQKELTLDLVDDFFSGPIVITWRKLERYLKQVRRERQRNTLFEWYQWLAEQLMEREKDAPPLPANIAHAPGTESYAQWLRRK